MSGLFVDTPVPWADYPHGANRAFIAPIVWWRLGLWEAGGRRRMIRRVLRPRWSVSEHGPDLDLVETKCGGSAG